MQFDQVVSHTISTNIESSIFNHLYQAGQVKIYSQDFAMSFNKSWERINLESLEIQIGVQMDDECQTGDEWGRQVLLTLQ